MALTSRRVSSYPVLLSLKKMVRILFHASSGFSDQFCQSSSPLPTRGSKRQRSPSHQRAANGSTRSGHQRRASDASGSSLPPSSPPPPFSDTDDGMDDRGSVPDANADLPDDEDANGEDLFDENILQE